MAQNIFNWNHISSDLSEEKISELKNFIKIITDYSNAINGNTKN